MNPRLLLPVVGIVVGVLSFGVVAWMAEEPPSTVDQAPSPPPPEPLPPRPDPGFQTLHPPADAPPPTDEQVWEVRQLPDGLRPLDPQTPEELAALSLVYDWLFYRGPDGAWRSRVVTDLQQEREGDRLWARISLRHDLKWHDGQPLTAGDLCFTVIERSVRTDSGSPKRCAVVDEYTARVQLPEPASTPLATLAFPILPAHLREVLHPPSEPVELHRQPVGSGPYTAQVSSRGVRFVAAAVPHHAPRIHQIDWRQATDPLTAARRLAQGHADVAFGLSILDQEEIIDAGGGVSDGGDLGRIAWADPGQALTTGPDAPLADLEGPRAAGREPQSIEGTEQPKPSRSPGR